MLQLQQVLDDDHRVAQHLPLFRPTQRLDLLDQVLEIQRREPSVTQEPRLDFGPDVEVLLVEQLVLGSRARGHVGSPAANADPLS